MNFIQFEKGQIQVVALGEVAERLPNFSSCQVIHFANFLMWILTWQELILSSNFGLYNFFNGLKLIS